MSESRIEDIVSARISKSLKTVCISYDHIILSKSACGVRGLDNITTHGALVTCCDCLVETYNKGRYLTEHQQEQLVNYLENTGITEPALHHIEIVGSVTI
jgi:hypothetical protein